LSATLPCGSQAGSPSQDDTPEQRVAYVHQLMAWQGRLAVISHRLAVNGVDLCGPMPRYATGAHLYDWDLSADPWIDAVNEALGINLHLPGIEVLLVVPDSPADAAGIQVGDRIMRLEDWRVPHGRGALKAFNRRMNALGRSGRHAVELGVERGGKFRSVSLRPVAACSYPTLLVDDEGLNAFADGETIVVLRGLLEFTASDGELALVIGHELAHNALQHIEATRQSVAAGALAGLAVDLLVAATLGIHTNIGRVAGASVGAHVYSDEHEAQADYLGLYLVARAGYEFEGAAGFLRRYAETLARREGSAQGRNVTTGRAEAMARYAREIREAKAGAGALYPAGGGRQPP
jgi:hypothetical protein